METSVTRREIEPGIWLDGRRALWLAASRVLIVADLHWGYAETHRAAGNLLPVWGDDVLANTLQALVADYQPQEMIWLGDVIHATAGRPRAEAYLAMTSVPVVVLRGNHDRSWRGAAAVPHLERSNFVLHHGDVPLRAPVAGRELIGHHHPAAFWSDRAGARFKLPALVAGPRRWIMPALSPWAAGTPWNHLLESDETLWAISARRIFPLPPRRQASRIG
jgi:uncharacterized protein